MGRNDKEHPRVMNPVAFVDIVMQHVAQEEAERAVSTLEEDRWARGVRQQVNSQLAALRRQLMVPASFPPLLRD